MKRRIRIYKFQVCFYAFYLVLIGLAALGQIFCTRWFNRIKVNKSLHKIFQTNSGKVLVTMIGK